MPSYSREQWYEFNRLRYPTAQYNTNKYPYDEGKGRCGSTAVAILLEYYSRTVDSNFIPPLLRDETGTKLTNYLHPLIEDKVSENYGRFDNIIMNATPPEVREGLQWYLDGILKSYLNSIGYENYDAYLSEFNFQKLKQLINLDIPIILGTSNHPDFHNHFVVACGWGIWQEKLGGLSNWTIVNDGWGNNNRLTDDRYFDSMIYISP